MAADVSARVHLVAEKLQQKAQDAQRKGNEGAARALAASVSDLRQALALISEQRHLLARRRGEGDDEDDEAAAPVQQLAARLETVAAMLGKKAEDMRAKSNEKAAAALQSSAGAVERGRSQLLEQQQTIFGLSGRWEQLEDVVDERRRRRSSVATSDGEEEDGDSVALLAKVKRLVQLGAVLREFFPECGEVEEVRVELEKRRDGEMEREKECERLQKELEAAEKKVEESRTEIEQVGDRLKKESVALEEAKQELERRHERETQRQEEDAALLEQQQEACQAMEELVRESDQEIQRMTKDAATRAEESQSVRVEVASLASEKERLVRRHTEEIEELHRQLESAMDALSTKTDETAATNAEELQLLRAEIDSLASEKENVAESYKKEIEELRRLLESAKDAVSANSDTNAVPNAKELQSLRAEIDSLKSEKEDLAESYAKEIEELQQKHSDEIEDIRSKRETATFALPVQTDKNEVSESEELQLLKTEIDSLTSEIRDLERTHAKETEELRKAHAEEIEKLHSQLESTTSALSTGDNEAASVEELHALQNEFDKLVLEKQHLSESHTKELEELRKTKADEIEKLENQLESATVSMSAKMEETEELQHLKADVDALVTEKSRLVNNYADEIEKLRSQLQSATVTTAGDAEKVLAGLNHEQSTNEDVSVDENEEFGDVPVLELEEEESQLQSTDMTDEDAVKIAAGDDDGMTTATKDTLELEAAIADLKAKMVDYEERSRVQQSLISTMEQKEVEFQEQIELLTQAKAQAVDELRTAHSEETAHLAQNVTESEGEIQELSAQLSEMQDALAATSAEKGEVEDDLMHCQTELSACRTKLETRSRECSQLKDDLQAAQNGQDAERGEVNIRLSLLVGEMREVAAAVGSNGKIDAAVVHNFTGKSWQSSEVMELCSGLSPLLRDLLSVQEQLHIAQQQLESVRDESNSQKMAIEQFMETADSRLFVTGGEEEQDRVSVKAVGECLSAAKTNMLQWLQEIDELRGRREEDSYTIQALEQENVQEKQRVATLEASVRDLQARIDSLLEQLSELESDKNELVKAAEKLQAQSHSATIQEQQQQAVQQEEVADLQQQLATVRGEFERYRVRSHTALKKMEKRAELLNGMRKENEELLKQVTESNRQRKEAEDARKSSDDRLQEVQRTQEMMQADFDQFAVEKARAIAELEEESRRLASERAQVVQRVQGLTQKVQELEMEKTQLEEETLRVKEAEEAAFQAHLNTATSAVQTAKKDLLKVHDALAASKAENDKRQKLIESLEVKLEQQEATTVVTNNSSPVAAHVNAPVAPVTSVVSPSAEDKRNMTALQNELTALRASETLLRKQVDDVRAELIALQERFATTKAANAEKVFALEEQSTNWKMQLTAATEEVRRLNAVLIDKKRSETQQPQAAVPKPDQANDNTATGVIEKQLRDELNVSSAQIQQLSDEVRELKTEQADANTEVTLLTRALDACREELQEARDQLDLLAPTSSEPENGEDPTAISKSAMLLAAKEAALKKLRVQVLELQEEVQTLRDEKTALELELEKEELDELQSSRQKVQSEKERAMQLQRREALLAGFEKQVSSIVKELQQRLEDHSTAFREVCDFRDEHRAFLFDKDAVANGSANGTTAVVGRKSDTEYEECLVMRSGVVIKAGASFQLPVICEKRGWRVVWNFSVKEDGADVAFKLDATLPNTTGVEVVASERMNETSGEFQVQHDNTTLVFEWDNSFSWLNEKTLDYHVSIQEPLTPQAQKVLHSKRELQTKAKLLEEGLDLVRVEAQRRLELSATLERLHECESLKTKHLATFEARKTEVLTQKTRFQDEMEETKAACSAMLQEQDEIEDRERGIVRAWEAAVAEREDVEMTLQLAGNGAQLETLAQKIEEQAKAVAEELERPTTTAVETEETSTSTSKADEETVVIDGSGTEHDCEDQGEDASAMNREETEALEKEQTLPDDATAKPTTEVESAVDEQ